MICRPKFRFPQYNDDWEHKKLSELLSESKKAYQHMLLKELFDFNPLLRRLSYLLKIVDENIASLHVGFRENFSKMQIALKTELSEVSDKFKPQIQQLINQYNTVEDNAALQERIKSACKYFAAKTDAVICNVLQYNELETDNKVVRKSVNEVLDHLKEESAIKLSCFKACMDGFIVKQYLETRAKAAITKPDVKQPAKTSSETVPRHIAHPKLYASLKTWRNSKASEQNVTVYLINHITELIDILNN